MAQAVSKKDFQVKPFFEDTMGLEIMAVQHNKGTLTYLMYSPQYKERVMFERRSDSSMVVTVQGTEKSIPTKDKLEVALGHEPTDMEVCRIIQQVILKMLDSTEDAVKRDVAQSFDRYSRRGH